MIMNHPCFWKWIVYRLLTAMLLSMVLVLPVFCDDQPTAIPSIVLKYRDQFYAADYSTQLNVYEVADSGVGGGGRRTFCFLPHPVLDASSLQKDFEKLRSSLSGAQKASTTSYSLPVHWTYKLDRVKSLLADFLKNKYGAEIRPRDIQTVPLNAYVVYGLLPNNTQITIKHLPDLPRGATNAQQVLADLPEPGAGNFIAPFGDLEAFVGNPAIGAYGYVTAAQLATTAITISGSIFSSTDFRDQINGKGGLTQTLNSQRSSGGVGVAIPVLGGLFGGQYESKGASESSSINRFVSRNFVQSALESGSSKIAIKAFTDKHSDQTSADVIKQLLSFALENMRHTTAKFEQQADGLYKLHSDSLNADIGTGMTLSKIAAATQGDSNFTGKLKNDIAVGKVKADETSELTQGWKSDISWSAAGNVQVPSTVDLYYMSNGQFLQDITADYIANEATYANYTYDSPATVTPSVHDDSVDKCEITGTPSRD